MGKVVVDYPTLEKVAGEMSQASEQIQTALTGSKVGSESVNAKTLDVALTYFAKAMPEVAKTLGGAVDAQAQNMQLAVLWFSTIDTRLADRATVPTVPSTTSGSDGDGLTSLLAGPLLGSNGG